MVGIASAGGGGNILASNAAVVEAKLGITFGYQPQITTRSEENMDTPILTSEGFEGQRFIINDYFRAGERLYAGDVVGIKQDSSNRGSHPRVFKVDQPRGSEANHRDSPHPGREGSGRPGGYNRSYVSGRRVRIRRSAGSG